MWCLHLSYLNRSRICRFCQFWHFRKIFCLTVCFYPRHRAAYAYPHVLRITRCELACRGFSESTFISFHNSENCEISWQCRQREVKGCYTCARMKWSEKQNDRTTNSTTLRPTQIVCVYFWMLGSYFHSRKTPLRFIPVAIWTENSNRALLDLQRRILKPCRLKPTNRQT